MKSTLTVAGQCFSSSATTLRIALTVSRMLAPLRLVTSRATAGWPLKRVMNAGSLKVRRTSPMSPMVTIRSPLFLIGRARMSAGFWTTPGTFMANMPAPERRSPAGTSWLLRAITPARSVAVTL